MKPAIDAGKAERELGQLIHGDDGQDFFATARKNSKGISKALEVGKKNFV
tara:strand:+ start:488 stop:637 length:150 start_codon:yes stop_codon:yes gene_type:complete